MGYGGGSSKYELIEKIGTPLYYVNVIIFLSRGNVKVSSGEGEASSAPESANA